MVDPCTTSSVPARPLPDRGTVATEQRNPGTRDLHRLSVRECIDRIQREDREVVRAMEAAAPALEVFVSRAEAGFVAGGRLVYVGAGTSGRLGVLDASECPPTFQVESGRVVGIIAGGDLALRFSSEGLEDDADGARSDLTVLGLGPGDSVLGIAAGGTTPFVLGSLRIAREQGAGLTGLFVCTPMEPPACCDVLIVAPTGPEVITGSTRMKAGTATKQALNTISTTLMVRAGRVYENLMVDLRASNDKLRDRGARVVSALTGLDRQEALALLARAGWGVKCAVVMHRLGIGAPEAERVLAGAGGRLGAALGEQLGGASGQGVGP